MTEPMVVPTLTESVPEETPPATPPESTPTEPAAPAAEPENTPTPTEDTPPADPNPAPTEALYTLPDGRQVNGAQLEQEYKNLLSDYTPKAQKLAQYESVNKPPAPPTEEMAPWEKPGWQPQNWQEALEAGRQMTLKSIADAAKQEEAAVNAVSTQVETQLAEIRKVDPQLNEGELFNHATKYGFRDLQQAHANMRAMKEVEVNTEKRVLGNISKRNTTPVAPPGGGPQGGDGVDMRNIQNFRSAQDFFRSLKH